MAQSSRGTVSGLVVDATKSALLGATVDLTNEDTKVVRNTTTNESGAYRFDAVDPGNYTVKVAAAGFKGYTVQPFAVTASKSTTIDAQLELGSVSSVVEVSSTAAVLQTEAPVRGGTINSASLVNLPIPTQNPVSLALTLPGVSTNRYSFGVATFSVNGARGRSNNFLIDGTENNDISVAGQAFQITNPDSVQEVAVQTGNYDAEYGRAGGAVVNTITKSGTNAFHGTARYLIDSTFDDALTNVNKTDPVQLQRGHPSPGTDQFFSGTVGGPVIRNKTFFFSAFQEERQVSTSTISLTSLSAAGRATLLSVFPTGTNRRADLLNQITAGADANSQFSTIALGNGRPALQIGIFTRPYPTTTRDRQLLERVDHTFSNSDQISFRYLYDSQVSPTGGDVGFFGFDTGFENSVNSGLINETHTFSPAATNELRIGYNRIYYYFPFNPTSPIASAIPTYTIAGFNNVNATNSLGVSGNYPQGRIANNYELQDTINYVRGKHSFRAGVSLLDQRSRQEAPINGRGSLSYQAGGGFTGLANFLDDFGGSAGSAARTFGSASYYPSLIRQGYFLQDRWRATEALTLTLGLRYEFFGNPINSVRTPAYTGLFNIDPRTFTGPYSQPNYVNSDLNNWAPTVGLAYSPSGGGPFGLFGQKKTVFRAGFQMGYDSFFNNIASNAVTSAPNTIATTVTSVVSTAAPRGTANLSSNFPITGVFSPLNTQNLVPKNLANPYYMRWSGGFQRELPYQLVLDVSYVGSRGVRLFINEDLNPLVPSSLQHFPAGYSPANLVLNQTYQLRFDPLQGSRLIRTNGGSSNYHSGQLSLSRRYSSGLQFNLAYTRSKFLDNGSDIFATSGNNLPQNTAIPSIFGGLRADRGISLYDRPNRLAITSVYELPFMRTQQGLAGHILGGWQISGVYTLESGAPINISNGVDADGLGGNFDRPVYNPNGGTGVRAIPSATSSTGYINPDTGAAIAASSAMYIGLPACTSTVNPCATGNLGRFTARTPRQNNLDADLTKLINLTERMHLEFRAEFFNVFNHRQYGTRSASPFDANATIAIGANVATTPANQFLNPIYADGGARVMRYQLKFVF